MDTHIKTVFALHAAPGALTLLVIAVVMPFMGGIAVLADSEPHVEQVAATFGGFLGATIGGIGLVQTLAGIRDFLGSAVARAWLVVTSLLALIQLPVGTFVGGYFLWALLRSAPAQRP
ncbi:MAG: hypothetical protein AB1430_05875 [Pseudomonadota bacterium]